MLQLYQNETKDYVFNKKCENKLVDIMMEYNNIQQRVHTSNVTAIPLPTGMNVDFKEVCNGLTLEFLLSKKSTILLPEARAFVRVRSDTVVIRGKRTFKNIPTLKDDLLARMIELIDHSVHPRFYCLPQEPINPVSEESGPLERRSDELDGADGNVSDGDYGDADMNID